MRFSTLLGVAGALLVASCASVSYTEPQDGPRARVRFAVGEAVSRDGAVALWQENAVVYGFSDAECSNGDHWMNLLDGFLVNSDPRSLNMPLWSYHQNAAKEFYVSAAQPVTVMFVGDMGTFNGVSGATFFCPVIVTAPLTAGADIEFVFRAYGPRVCMVEMSELVSGASGPERRTIRRFDNSAQEVSAGCIAFFNRAY